jgi:mannan polymerase II complex ANP1 subunit
MAKRMGFSVVGLPHYTIWHLYEPSIDDIRHMEEMETERRQKEAEEKSKADRLTRIKDDFEKPDLQWQKDKESIQKAAKEDAAKDKGQTLEKVDGSEAYATPHAH